MSRCKTMTGSLLMKLCITVHALELVHGSGHAILRSQFHPPPACQKVSLHC